MRTEGAQGTWLDGEELSKGPIKGSQRKARVRCEDGKVRTATCAVGRDTIPAKLKANNKTVAGFVEPGTDGVFNFHASRYRRNFFATAPRVPTTAEAPPLHS